MLWFWPLRLTAAEETKEDDPSDPESEENSDKEENDDSTDDEKLFKYHKCRNEKAKTATKTHYVNDDDEGEEISYEVSLLIVLMFVNMNFC